jgi:hypothetical protein
LREFAAAGIEAQVKEAVDTWTEHQDDLSKRIKRLTVAADRLEGQAGRTDDDERSCPTCWANARPCGCC